MDFRGEVAIYPAKSANNAMISALGTHVRALIVKEGGHSVEREASDLGLVNTPAGLLQANSVTPAAA